ncbi:holo-ACP synthase [Cohaesibacter sp. ES.047]|uniref:citrate lyase holo-[acyl-carrier protein] synthase n=1 Tax=Cohaesibacter sp. ES.047 TaxID=1798205 RepID=UPI000BB7B32E|nr:citrate lyase holo-[acyl-carrier protein] synthase [Cohaesibacter sp. ES.047]SNY93199.1 holo-ACP synthase [Cohaesibacter sp. ES.047]
MKKSGLLDGPVVTVPEILSAKDQRVQRRVAAQQRHHLPSLTMTIVMPGAIKTCALSLLLADQARTAIDRSFKQQGWSYETVWTGEVASGPECLYLVDATPETLKRAMVAIEVSHPLGRLWDLDVHSAQGEGLSRKQVGFPPRKCLLCDEEAHACARSRAHTIEELREGMKAIVTGWQPEDSEHR